MYMSPPDCDNWLRVFGGGRICLSAAPGLANRLKCWFFWMVQMAGSQWGQAIPTKLSGAQFEQFVLPHLSRGTRGAASKLSPHAIFNYILKLLYPGCQWKELPIEKDRDGRPEIHHTRIYRAVRRWEAQGCIAAVFAGSVPKLHPAELLDISIIHGDGTTTAAKKSGDNMGFSGQKKMKGDKVVAFCDRNCNVIAPFVAAPGNGNESPLLRSVTAGNAHRPRDWHEPARHRRQPGWCLRLPGQPQGDFQSRHDAQHQP
ncbi:hypothetical protein PQR34_47515 [Paraburkholderia sediminicola]|uniref:hypothetical protein n=1 Tax=Paraburkholderia sediminicola TaxID=458836 RepID=UPI0038B7C8B5